MEAIRIRMKRRQEDRKANADMLQAVKRVHGVPSGCFETVEEAEDSVDVYAEMVADAFEEDTQQEYEALPDALLMLGMVFACALIWNCTGFIYAILATFVAGCMTIRPMAEAVREAMEK